MSTSFTKFSRVTENKGYEVRAEIPQVQNSVEQVLRERGYQVGLQKDPQLGPEGAGVDVIGEKQVRYHAEKMDPNAFPQHPQQLNYRDVMRVTLSKKWAMGGSKAVEGVTLLNVYGLTYERTAPDAPEQEQPIKVSELNVLRNEIESRLSNVGSGPSSQVGRGEAQGGNYRTSQALSGTASSSPQASPMPTQMMSPTAVMSPTVNPLPSPMPENVPNAQQQMPAPQPQAHPEETPGNSYQQNQ